MHYNKGDESCWVDLISGFFGKVTCQRRLYNRSLAQGVCLGSVGAPWPSSVSIRGQPIEIDHRCREATSILPEVVKDVFSYREPGTYSAAALTQTRVTHNARADRLIADAN